MKSTAAATLFLLLVLPGSTGCTHSNKAVPEQRATGQRTISDIAHDSLKSVVTVVTSDGTGQPLEQGSGFIVTPDGKIVTNYHVIAGAASAVVKLADGGVYGVEGVVGADKEKDLAILKLKASEREFPPLHPPAVSDQMRVGDEVVAIGSPLGLEGTVSTGVVSAKRTMPGFQIEVLQISAPISPGSSGGALLNAKGEVVGVPFIQVEGGQNLNFAIPIRYVSVLIVDAPAKPFATPAQPVVAKKSAPRRAPAGGGSLAETPRQTPQPPPPSPEQLHQVANTASPNPSELNGTYTGFWRSTVFAASGAAVMTVWTEGKLVHADIALTGGQVTRDTLTGEASEVGGGWSITLRNAAGNLYATGIFKTGVFEGDYDYVSASDHGRWGLKKD